MKKFLEIYLLADLPSWQVATGYTRQNKAIFSSPESTYYTNVRPECAPSTEYAFGEETIYTHVKMKVHFKVQIDIMEIWNIEVEYIVQIYTMFHSAQAAKKVAPHVNIVASESATPPASSAYFRNKYRNK